MVEPAAEHRWPQIDAATIEIFIDNRFLCLDGGLPDGQGTNIGIGLDEAVYRRIELPAWSWLSGVDQATMFQLVKDIDELAASEAAKQQPPIVAVGN
jgi:hypothetical protein